MSAAADASASPMGLHRTAQAQDVDFAYALVLGRGVESEAARLSRLQAQASVAAVLLDLLAAAEFEDGVAAPLAAGALAPGRFLQSLGATGRAWARDLFGAGVADGARTWLELLMRLQAAGVLDRLAPAQERGGATVALAEALGALRGGAATSDAAVVAEVESCDGERLRGWAVDLADPDRSPRLELWIDGRFARTLAPDRFRRDLQDRYGGDGRVAFDATLPLGASDAGRPLRIEVRTAAGRTVAQAATVARGPVGLDAVAALKAELQAVRAALERIEQAMPDLRARTAFSLAGWADYARTFYAEPADEGSRQGLDASAAPPVQVRVRRGSASAARLEAALRSVAGQTGVRPAIRVAADALDDPGQLEALAGAVDAGEGRIAVGPAAGAVPTDGLVVFMTGDDRLAPGALAAFAGVHAAGPACGLVYADDDRAPAAGSAAGHGAGEGRGDPGLKPPFDPYLLLQENYVGAVYGVDAGLLATVDRAGEPVSDHARLLQLSQAAGRGGVVHIPRVLSHRAGPADARADAAAVAEHLLHLGAVAQVSPHADVIGASRRATLRLRGTGLEGVSASVVIATRDRLDLLRPCVESLERTRAANRVRFEVVVVDNGGVKPAACAYLHGLAGRPGTRVLRDPAPFNWAAINTRAALQQRCDVLVFLNDDTLAVSPDWCDELCFWALQPQVGAAGARLLYDDGTIQHAGVVMGRGGSARHEGVGEPGGEGGYLGRRQLVHATSAVTGACLATRAEVFRRLDGFDAARFAVAFNDMDYCLRAAELGLDSVYTPHATFTHLESKSRGFGDADDRPGMARAREELDAFQRRHAAALRADRWMNPHFEREAPAFTLLAPPPPY